MKLKTLFKKAVAVTFFAVTGLTLTAPAQETDGYHIPVVNADFEAGMEGWSVWKSFTGQITAFTGEARSGRGAIQVDARTTSNNPLAAQTVKGLQGGVTYRLQAWAKLAPGSPGAEGAVKLETYNAEGKNTDGQYGRIAIPADGHWHPISIVLSTKPDTVRADLLLRVYGKGAVLFDDVTLETTSISVVKPVQSAVLLDEETRIKYLLKLYQPWTEEKLPVMTATLSSKATDFSQTLSTQVEKGDDNQHFWVTVPVTVSQHDDYQLRFSLMRDGKRQATQYPAKIFTALKDRKPEYVTENGILLHQGKPFFPIGMYHVGHTDAGYKLLADNGFNAVQGLVANDLKRTKDTLDWAHKYGMVVDVPLYGRGQVAQNLKNSLEKIRLFADHPAVLNWKILDEPEYRPQVSDEIPAVYRALKAADPRHSFELTLNRAPEVEFWKHFADKIQINVYPVPKAPLTNIAAYAQTTMKHKEPWQPFIFVVQCGWTPDMATMPTVAQARSMVYLALIEGAKGIFWYSMYDPGWDLTKTKFWPEMKAINAEIKTLSQPLMLGEEVKGIESDNNKVYFNAWRHEGKVYLLVTNPESEAGNITLKLPKTLTGKNLRTLDGQPVTQAKTGEIALNLEAIDSRTLVMESE